MATQMIKSGKELRDHFFQVRHNKQKLEDGVMVSSVVRREILLSIEQGKIILEGTVYRISFENLSGGVYRAYITKLNPPRGEGE